MAPLPRVARYHYKRAFGLPARLLRELLVCDRYGIGRWYGPAKREVIGDGGAWVSTFGQSEARRLWLVAGRLALRIACPSGSRRPDGRHPAILWSAARHNAARGTARRQRPLPKARTGRLCRLRCALY